MSASLAQRIAASSASRKKYPDRARARNAVSRAINAGTLVRPEACERCGVGCKPDASHDDYSRPLDVEWLCRPCHAKKDLVTTCHLGHSYTPENTYTRPSGFRQCRECRRAGRKPKK